MSKSQSSEKPSALELLTQFLKQNKITIHTLPLKTWTDDRGRFVIDPPQVAVEFVKEKTEQTKK